MSIYGRHNRPHIWNPKRKRQIAWVILAAWLAITVASIANAATYIKGPALIEGVTSTASAGGTTTLTADSETNQVITGTDTQTVKLPAASALPVGRRFVVHNRSTGIVSVIDGNNGALKSLPASTSMSFVVLANGSTAGTWAVDTVLPTLATGVMHVTNGTLSSSSIVNADVDAAAGIVDTKLATISTAGKVANSATTADSANTADAIVTRDSNGDFAAGEITADLVGNVTGDVTGNITGNVTGNADTATALAANPSDCGADTYAQSIGANGDLSCATVTNAGLSGSIALSKLASGSTNRVLVNNGSGQPSENAAITASRAIVSDSNGLPTHSTTTATEIGYVNGVTSSIQSQINTAMPSGAILSFARQTCPSGWQETEGAAISRTTYANLFAAVGTAYGYGDGSTTFNLPDLRGLFLRGVDGAGNIDPDKTTRAAFVSSTHTVGSCTVTNGSATVTCSSTANLAPGMTISGTGVPASTVIRSITNGTDFVMGNLGNSANVNGSATNSGLTLTFSRSATGNYLGSLQTNATKLPNTSFTTNDPGNHTHGISTGFANANNANNLSSTGSRDRTNTTDGGGSHTHTITGGGDNETRPRNIYVRYCIKE